MSAPDRTAWGEPLLSADDLAAALGFTRRQVYELVEKSGLPAYKLGRSLRFELAAVRGWLEHRRIGDWPASVGGLDSRARSEAHSEVSDTPTERGEAG